jgi:hypothetical protein
MKEMCEMSVIGQGKRGGYHLTTKKTECRLADVA